MLFKGIFDLLQKVMMSVGMVSGIIILEVWKGIAA